MDKAPARSLESRLPTSPKATAKSVGIRDTAITTAYAFHAIAEGNRNSLTERDSKTDHSPQEACPHQHGCSRATKGLPWISSLTPHDEVVAPNSRGRKIMALPSLPILFFPKTTR